jgi:hypothetical protein
MMSELVTEFLSTFPAGMAEGVAKLAGCITKVSYGKLGTLRVQFKSTVISIPEPEDVLLVDAPLKLAAHWIVSHHFELFAKAYLSTSN